MVINLCTLFFYRRDDLNIVVLLRTQCTPQLVPECFSQAGSLAENISQPGKETADCNQEENCCSLNEDHLSSKKLQIIKKSFGVRPVSQVF